jgi:hypothetical protein
MNYTPTKGESLWVPPEIWVGVIKCLDSRDVKNFRLVNRSCRSMATPHCFETVIFDISQASIEKLGKVASMPALAECVRKVVLQRRPRMRRFDDYEEWERAFDLSEYPKLTFSSFNHGNCQENTHDDIMSWQEWSQYTDDAKIALYDRYEADREARNDNAQSLSRTLCFRTKGCTCSEQVQSVLGESPMEVDCILRRLDDAVSKFTKLTVFEHRPTRLLGDRWVVNWQRLCFHTIDPEDDAYEEDCEEDDDMEALQLSCALRAIAWARRDPPTLNSMGFHVDGPAFWSPSGLRRLWQGEGHWEVRELRHAQNAMQAEERFESIQQDLTRHDECVRALGKVVGGLTHLHCSISEDERKGGLFMAAKVFFELLRCGQNLKSVRLAFGELLFGLIVPPSDWDRTNGDGPKTLFTLLADHKPWSKIEELKIQIVTDETTLLRFLESLSLTLRRLTLSTVTLAPEGTWDSALPAIATRLTNLIMLDLELLYDFTKHGQKRLLFNPAAETWAGKDASYNHYKEHVIGQLLLVGELPELSPEWFMDEYE